MLFDGVKCGDDVFFPRSSVSLWIVSRFNPALMLRVISEDQDSVAVFFLSNLARE